MPLISHFLRILIQQHCRLNCFLEEVTGSGKISASILVSDKVERSLDYILSKQNEKGVRITLHPYLYAYFKQGTLSHQLKWFFKYLKWVKLESDTSLGITDYHFHNKLGEAIEVV